MHGALLYIILNRSVIVAAPATALGLNILMQTNNFLIGIMITNVCNVAFTARLLKPAL
jgi:hypothetical protein